MGRPDLFGNLVFRGKVCQRALELLQNQRFPRIFESEADVSFGVLATKLVPTAAAEIGLVEYP
jgi:hypothetical protein